MGWSCSIIKRDNVLATSVIHCWRCTLLSSNAILACFSPSSSLDPLRGRLRWVMAGREIVINELSCFPRLFRLPSSLHGPHPPPFLPPLPLALYPRFLSRHSQALRFRQYVYILRYVSSRFYGFPCTCSLGYGFHPRFAETARVRTREVIRDGLAGDASILQRSRYVGIASRGSLSRTANYGIMHTAGLVPQLWLCYEFVLTQESLCRRNGCARRRTAEDLHPRPRTFIPDTFTRKRCKSVLGYRLHRVPPFFFFSSFQRGISYCHDVSKNIFASRLKCLFCFVNFLSRFLSFFLIVYVHCSYRTIEM